MIQHDDQQVFHGIHIFVDDKFEKRHERSGRVRCAALCLGKGENSLGSPMGRRVTSCI